MQTETWEQICARIDEKEPSLAGYAMSAACRMADYVSAQGVNEQVSNRVMSETAKALLMVIEATLDGQRQLWADLLPHSDKEMNHG